METHDIIIIGGGASGVFLSLLLKDYGKDVALLEGKDRILKKLLTTGNGRCNITNAKVMEEIPSVYTTSTLDYDFAPLKTFPLEETLSYFMSLGLHFTTLEDHKMYPLSLQAASVVDLLRLAIEDKGVPLHLNEKVKTIQKKGGFFHLATGDKTYSCKYLIISTGGMAAPSTGSDGSLFKILKSLGHEIIPPRPALVQMNLDAPFLKALSGVKIEGKASLYQGNTLLKEESGELLFTDYGISGPPILQLSRFLHPHLHEGALLTLKLSFFNELEEEDLKELLLNQAALFPHRSAMDACRSILPKKLIPVLLREAGMAKPSALLFEEDPKHLVQLASLLKGWSFTVTGTQGFALAQGTYGGVAMNEVKPTLESTKVSHLYFTGEVLDVLGACGGYNLQWAWSTAGTVFKALT